MRTLVFLDLKIDKEEALVLLADYGEWYESQTGIKCTFWVERRDFSVVPTIADSDGDLKPTYEYRQALATDVHKRYGDYGVDHIVMMVHDDNFLFKGVWGTAWAYSHYKYMLELVRWDKKNSVNTWNTLFHENGGHPADTLIRKELGIEINPLLRVEFNEPNFDYDRDYVHGGSPQFEYIGRRTYTRDGRMLKFLAPLLKRAYQSRKDKHDKHVGLQKTLIGLLQKFVELLKLKK